MTREEVFLGPAPDDPVELDGFPADEKDAGIEVWRVVSPGYGAWWFGSSMGGRFNLPHPHGTCYVAMDDIGALMEFIGTEMERGIVARGTLRKRRLRRLTLQVDYVLADCTARRAGQWITSEIHTIVPYDLPQGWASAFHQAGFAGVAYRTRFDPSGPKGLALFGEAGENGAFNEGFEEAIEADHEARLHDQCGIIVQEIPSVGDLSFASPSL